MAQWLSACLEIEGLRVRDGDNVQVYLFPYTKVRISFSKGEAMYNNSLHAG